MIRQGDWCARSEPLANVSGLRFGVGRGGYPASFAEILAGWRGDDDCCALFDRLIADAPFAALRWETPAASAATLSRPFEFVLLDSPELAQRSDPAAFAEHFTNPHPQVVTFANLGGDALLVVPCPDGGPADYAHLAAFVRFASPVLRRALWRAVGEAMMRRISARPVWLSTAGTGVPWLHVRLDDRPKYYLFEPYRQMPG